MEWIYFFIDNAIMKESTLFVLISYGAKSPQCVGENPVWAALYLHQVCICHAEDSHKH